MVTNTLQHDSHESLQVMQQKEKLKELETKLFKSMVPKEQKSLIKSIFKVPLPFSAPQRTATEISNLRTEYNIKNDKQLFSILLHGSDTYLQQEQDEYIKLFKVYRIMSVSKLAGMEKKLFDSKTQLIEKLKKTTTQREIGNIA